MNSRDFCFWLQGYFELNGSDDPGLTIEQRRLIKEHLALVFRHDIGVHGTCDHPATPTPKQTAVFNPPSYWPQAGINDSGGRGWGEVNIC